MNNKQIIDKLGHVTILFARLRYTNSNHKSLAFSHQYA